MIPPHTIAKEKVFNQRLWGYGRLACLSRYILHSLYAPFFIFLFIFTIMIWLIQSLNILDQVLVDDKGWWIASKAFVFIVPRLLSFILPLVLFFACLYTLNNLLRHGELPAIFSAGIGTWQSTRAFFILTAWVTVFLALFVFYISPLGMRAFKTMIFNMRGDVVVSLFREGMFTQPVDNVTFYAQKKESDGRVQGIFVYDGRKEDNPIIYSAPTGRFVYEDGQDYLLLSNGTIHQLFKGNPNQGIHTVSYQVYSYNLSDMWEDKPDHAWEASQLFIHQLLFPDLENQEYKTQQEKLKARGHDGVASLLYPLVFTMIALAFFFPLTFDRKGYLGRTGMAIATVVGISLLRFAAMALAVQNNNYIPLIYAIPTASLLVTIATMSEFSFKSKGAKLVKFFKKSTKRRGRHAAT